MVDAVPMRASSEKTAALSSSVARPFAVLGLRPLYFMLAGMMRRFVYLQTGLSVVLVFVGAKFVISDVVFKVPIWVSLPFIATVVSASILPPSGRPAGRYARPFRARRVSCGHREERRVRC